MGFRVHNRHASLPAFTPLTICLLFRAFVVFVYLFIVFVLLFVLFVLRLQRLFFVYLCLYLVIMFVLRLQRLYFVFIAFIFCVYCVFLFFVCFLRLFLCGYMFFAFLICVYIVYYRGWSVRVVASLKYTVIILFVVFFRLYFVIV